MEELQQSSYYRQAGPAANRRMEQAVSMGLPAMANPADWTPFGSRGIEAGGRNIPMGYLPPQGGFGTFGSVGMDRERKGSTGRIQSGAPLGSGRRGGGPQPAAQPSRTPTPTPSPQRQPMPAGSFISDQYGSGYSSQPMGFTGSPISFTAAGPRAGMKPSPTATSTPPPFPEFDADDYWRSSGFGGIPKFPVSSYY
jgi:hypothetical protein